MQNSNDNRQPKTVLATSLGEIDACAFDTAYLLQAHSHALFKIELDETAEPDRIGARLTMISGRLDVESQEHLLTCRLEELAAAVKKPGESLLPFIWSEQLNRWTPIGGSTEFSAKWPFGDAECLTLGLFFPSGNSGILGFVLKDVRRDGTGTQLERFHSLGLVIVARTIQLQSPGAPRVLSKNERLCLVWCAKGKTSLEIARILSLSEHTINHYFSVATSKLDAASRSHAIAKAIKIGLIGYDEIA